VMAASAPLPMLPILIAAFKVGARSWFRHRGRNRVVSSQNDNT